MVQDSTTRCSSRPTHVLRKDYCNDDSSVTSSFTAANVAAVRARIAAAYQNVRTAMRNAGYADGAWTLLVQS